MSRPANRLGYRFVPWLVAALLAADWLSFPVANADEFSSEQLQQFEKQIRPLLIEHCAKCHGPKKQEGGLNLTTRALLIQGGDSGPALVPGNAAESRILAAVKYGGDMKMPPGGKLSADFRRRERDAGDIGPRAGRPWRQPGLCPARTPRRP